MGHTADPKPCFDNEVAKNKRLVLAMLRYEDVLIRGREAQDAYKAFRALGHHSLDVERMTARQTLDHFGFSTGDASLATYRGLSRLYPDDDDIKEAVTYLRANRCLRYTLPFPSLGTPCPNPLVHRFCMKTGTTVKAEPLHTLFDRTKDTRIVAAFSSS